MYTLVDHILFIFDTEGYMVTVKNDKLDLHLTNNLLVFDDNDQILHSTVGYDQDYVN
jgi:hypothetical protein